MLEEEDSLEILVSHALKDINTQMDATVETTVEKQHGSAGHPDAGMRPHTEAHEVPSAAIPNVSFSLLWCSSRCSCPFLSISIFTPISDQLLSTPQ
jgi:hypothetical protein